MKTRVSLYLIGLVLLGACDDQTSGSDSKTDSVEQDTLITTKTDGDSCIDIAKEYFLSEMLRPKSFELLEFKKTNGYEIEHHGIKLYVLEWEVRVSVGEDILTKASNKTGVSYSSSGYQRAFPSKGDNTFDCWENISDCQWKSYYRKLYPGSLLQFTGDCYLQNTENGWRIYDREGGVYKTFEIISEGGQNNDTEVN